MTAADIASLIGAALFVISLIAFIKQPSRVNFITAAERGLSFL